MSKRDKAIKFRLTDDERRSKYYVRDRQQIVAVLNELRKKSTNLFAYYRTGQRNIVTSIVAVFPNKDLLILETATSQRCHNEILREGSLFCFAKVYRIQVNFQLIGIQETSFRDDAVYVSPFPDGIYRPQRRDFFRVATPILTPVMCSFTKEDIGAQKLTLVNVSVGGVCLVDSNPNHQYLLGELLTDVVLELDGFGTIESTLKVQNIIWTSRKYGRKAIRIGCRFIGLSMADSTLIQRYLHRLQLERLSH